jgi:hypothetical protein
MMLLAVSFLSVSVHPHEKYRKTRYFVKHWERKRQETPTSTGGRGSFFKQIIATNQIRPKIVYNKDGTTVNLERKMILGQHPLNPEPAAS